MALVMKIAKIFFVVAGLKLEVGEIPISNGEIINKNDAFAQIQAKITNTRYGYFDKCLSKEEHIRFEIKDGDAVFTCNAKTNSELGGGNKRRKKSKKTKKKKQTKRRKTMNKKRV
jgi:hypothetical protein